MRYLLVLLALAGCASPQSPASFDVAKYEPACARQCLDGYSRCISGSSNSLSRLMANQQMDACHANTQQCLSTCPAR